MSVISLGIVETAIRPAEVSDNGAAPLSCVSRLAAFVGLWRRCPGGARARPAAAERQQFAWSDERPQWWPRRPPRRSAVPPGTQRRRLAVPKALLLHTRLQRLLVLAARCARCNR